MKYFSENADFVNAECEHCKRILNIKREQTTPNSTGFSLNTPGVPCKCGAVHHNIIGTKKDLALQTRSVISFIIVVIGGGSLVALVLFIIGYTIFASPQEITAKQAECFCQKVNANGVWSAPQLAKSMNKLWLC